MALYRFKTYRTQYYFPDSIKGRSFLFGLYHPYNRFPLRLIVIKIFWWLYRHCKFVRKKYLVEKPDEEFPYSKIMELMPAGSVVSFNLGTPGPEQKISMLGLDKSGKHFFAKYSTKEGAMALSRNELKVLEALKDLDIAPELFEYKDGGDFVFFSTSCVEGNSPTDVCLTAEIVKLATKINKIKITNGELKTCFCHGDFTPWNLLITPTSELKMIDWELANEFELGYDLFVYIAQVGGKLNPEIPLSEIIEKNKKFIDEYFHAFAISDWRPYLKAFAKRKIAYEMSKDDSEYAKQFECLL